MMKTIIPIVVFLVSGSFAVWAQKEVKIANSLYDRLSYHDAIPVYSKLLKKDSSLFEAKAKLADCYRLTGNYRDAENLYSSVVRSDKAEYIHRFYYGQMLMNNGRYQEARKWLKRTEDESPNDERPERFVKSIDTYTSFFNDSANYTLSSVAINTPGNDFAPVYYKSGIVYSASDVKAKRTYRHSWTGQSYTRLYLTDSTASALPKPFADEIQIDLNNGPASFNASGNEIFLTVNYLKLPDSKKGIYKLSIVSSVYNGKKWSKPENFVHNNASYNVAHPSVGNDGSKLYFASDMSGGQGGMDLYVCQREGEKWGIPKNLGPTINTPGNELFPFVHPDGTLYFSSNGHEGLGGLDVYSSKENDGKWTSPANLGAPVNSRLDDFSFIVNEKKTDGYFSSNREQGKGGDDLYRFTFVERKYLRALVSDKYKRQPIANAKIQLYDALDNRLLQEGIAEDFKFESTPCREYKLVSTKEGLPSVSTTVKTSCSPKDETVSIDMGIPPIEPSFFGGIVYEQGTTTVLDSVTTVLLDKTGKSVSTLYTNKDGRFSLGEFANASQLTFFKQGYFSVTKLLKEEKSKKEIVVEMPRLQMDKVIKLEGIFYDLGKYAIRADAARVLDNVVEVMQENPTLEIELSAHTDARGSDQSNLSLSDSRAKAAAAYIVSKGIDTKRIKGKGYGETQLKNECGNGVKCTEPKHQENRRTEAKIVKY
jgi:outer membrane protein OmpA-like peptidoglycan-associated protein